MCYDILEEELAFTFPIGFEVGKLFQRIVGREEIDLS